MSTLQAVLAVLGGLFGLALVGGSIYAYAKAGAQGQIIARLRDERDDYLSRLNYIEPRFKSTQEQNETLRTLVDPSGRLDEIRDTVRGVSEEILAAVQRSSSNSEAMKAVLLSQARTLDDIKTHIHVDRGEDR